MRGTGNARKIEQTGFERGRALDARHCVARYLPRRFSFFTFFQMEMCKAAALDGGGRKRGPLRGKAGSGVIAQPFPGELHDTGKFREEGGQWRGGVEEASLLFPLTWEERTHRRTRGI